MSFWLLLFGGLAVILIGCYLLDRWIKAADDHETERQKARARQFLRTSQGRKLPPRSPRREKRGF